MDCPDTLLLNFMLHEHLLVKNTAMLIPPAWQFPEIAEASIDLEGKTFQTAQFRETAWMQAYTVIVHGKPVGKVTVC